jgi:hypothetical protein
MQLSRHNAKNQPLNQQGEGLRTTGPAVAGGTVTVNVGPNDYVVEIKDGTTGNTTKLAVEPGKDTSIPIPNVPGGTIVIIVVGRGINARAIPVEVVAPGP